MKQILESKPVRFVLSAGIAFLLYWKCPPCLSKMVLGAVLLILLLIINFSEFIGGPHIILRIFRGFFRIGVGGLFIFSGFIKANDPLGFAYKLEEYFDVFAEDAKGSNFLVHIFHGFHDAALFLAIFICVVEMVLGFMLLLGVKTRTTLWLLLLQIVFFTFLTFYSACYNKVTHCGCFGDFLLLTPWESFAKDLVLMIAISIVWTGRDSLRTLMNPFLGNMATGLFLLASIAFPVYCWYYLPTLDFRAYAPGKNLCEEMKPGPHYKAATFRSHFVYKNIKTGKKEEFTDLNYPWKDTLNWAYDTALAPTVLQAAVDEPKITDLRIVDPESGEDLTDSILKNPDYHFLLIAKELDTLNMKAQSKINEFVSFCDKEKKQFIGLSSASYEQIRNFRFKAQAMYPYLVCDNTVLKTMIRSNPGLILMKGCVVVANWPWHSFPTYTDVKTKYFKP